MKENTFSPSPAADEENARSILLTQDCTCVLCRGETTYTATLRGVRPLMQWLTGGTDLKGFSAADKVVGRATAFLYCLLSVRSVYANVMSKAALEVLQDHGIEARYTELTEHIINRQGTGLCPFEAAVLDIRDPEEALAAIRSKMKELNIPL